jgi:hypothetical protein
MCCQVITVWPPPSWRAASFKGEKMNEKPILFSGEMVRAILDGRKTQTRRVIKPQPRETLDVAEPFKKAVRGEVASWRFASSKDPTIIHEYYLSRFNIGDLLWVRETFRPLTCGYDCKIKSPVEYRADKLRQKSDIRWKPNIFMPKWATRIWLEITAVRVERVQDISEADAKVEGVRPNVCVSAKFVNGKWIVPENEQCPSAGANCCPSNCLMEWENYQGDCDADPMHSAKESFQSLWDSINAKRKPTHIKNRIQKGRPTTEYLRNHPEVIDFSWESNPFVWCISFKKVSE